MFDKHDAAISRMKGKHFKWLNETTILNMPLPNYLIDKLIPEGAVCILYGRWGSYKSFVAIDMSECVTTGIDYHGYKTVQGGVAYLAGEGAGGLGKRLRAWKTHHKVTAQSPFYLNRDRFNLLDNDDVDRLIKDLWLLHDEHGVVFLLLFVDTLSRAINGRIENEEAFGLAIANAEKIKEAMTKMAGRPCSVIMVHHSGKDRGKGVRGSSVLDSNADAVLAMDVVGKKEPGKPVNVKLSVEKLKDDEDNWELDFLTESVTTHRPDINVDEQSIVLVLKSAPTAQAQQQADIKLLAEKFAESMGAGVLGKQFPVVEACRILNISQGKGYDKIKLIVTPAWQTVTLDDGTQVRLRLEKKGGSGKDKITVEWVDPDTDTDDDC